MYKNNSRDSSKFKGCSPLQLLCNLTGMKHAVGYYSYTNRYPQAEKPAAHFSTFGFCRHTKPTLKKPKELKFSQRYDLDSSNKKFNFVTYSQQE
jgi:hypothetical protein